MEIDFELVVEGISLGLDVVILGFLYKSYESCCTYIDALKAAEQVEISQLGQLRTAAAPSRGWWSKLWPRKKSSLPDSSNEFRYVCLRGLVEPLEKSRLLHSTDNQSTGVIHKILTKEVATVRNGTRLWVDEERVVRNIQHEIPWGLRSQETTSSSNKKGFVKIIDGLSADRVDMSIVRDEFTPAAFSLSGWLGGWVAGVQLKGTNEVEEMLIDGSLLTAVGELVINSDGSMQLRSPNNSERTLPFILSTLPFSELLNTYETLVSVCKWSLFFFGGVGMVLCSLMVRRWLRIKYGRRHAREEEDILRDLRETRPSNEENDDLPDWQRCVVCLVRNREVIVLPCGHVCLCADCMVLINRQHILQRKCPMCRQRIEQIARAFVS